MPVFASVFYEITVPLPFADAAERSAEKLVANIASAK